MEVLGGPLVQSLENRLSNNKMKMNQLLKEKETLLAELKDMKDSNINLTMSGLSLSGISKV